MAMGSAEPDSGTVSASVMYSPQGNKEDEYGSESKKTKTNITHDKNKTRLSHNGFVFEKGGCETMLRGLPQLQQFVTEHVIR